MEYRYKIGNKTYRFESDTPQTDAEIRRAAMAQAVEEARRQIESQGSGMSSLQAAGEGVENVVRGAGQLVDEASGKLNTWTGGKVPRTDMVPDQDIEFARRKMDLLKQNSSGARAAHLLAGAVPGLMLPGGQAQLAKVPLLNKALASLGRTKLVKNAAPYVRKMVGGAVDAALPSAEIAALQPTLGLESRAENMKNAAEAGAMAGAAIPAVGSVARGVVEHLPFQASKNIRAKRLAVEAIPEAERGRAIADLESPTVLPLSSAAKTGNPVLAGLENTSRKQRPTIWGPADANLQTSANRELDLATAGRKRVPALQKRESDMFKDMGNDLEQAAATNPAAWQAAQDEMIGQARARMPKQANTRPLEALEARILREDIPFTTAAATDARTVAARTPDERPVVEAVDAGLNRLSGGRWGDFMGPNATYGLAKQATKESESLGNVYEQFISDVGPVKAGGIGDYATLGRNALVNALRKNVDNDYGQVMRAAPQERLGNLADELAMAEKAAKTRPDMSGSENLFTEALKTALPWRARPLAPDLIRAGRSNVMMDRAAEYLSQPALYAKILREASAPHPLRDQSKEYLLRLLRGGVGSDAALEQPLEPLE